MSEAIVMAAQREMMSSIGDIGKRLEERKSADIEMRARLQALEQESVSPRRQGPDHDVEHNVVAQEVIASAGFEHMQSGLPTSGRISIQQGVRAALTNPERGSAGSTSYPTQPNRAAGIMANPAANLTLLSVLPVIPVSGQTFEYVVLDDFVNTAKYQVKEGDEKAKAEVKAIVQRAEVSTIAHYLPASRQVLDDNSELERALGMLLSVSCAQKLEHELLNGEGGEGEIRGLLKQAQEFEPVSTHAADRIGEAATDLSAAGWNAGVIILHPSDWFYIECERAETGNGQYTLGSPRDPSPRFLWTVPVVLSPSMEKGKALLFDRSMVAVLDRQSVTVEMSRSDGDNFKRNMVTILAELRAGLVVFATSATRLIDLDPLVVEGEEP